LIKRNSLFQQTEAWLESRSLLEWILEASSLAVEQISVAEQMGEKEGESFPSDLFLHS